MRLYVFFLLLPFTQGCDFDSSYISNDAIKNIETFLQTFRQNCMDSSVNFKDVSTLKLKDDEQVLQAVFKKLGKLDMTLEVVESSWGTLDLSSLSSIKPGRKLIIQDNFNLKRIIVPASLRCSDCELKVRGNPLLNPKDIKNLQSIVDKNNKLNMKTASVEMEADIQQHEECSGKHITQLKDLENCPFVYGDLIMEGPNFSGSLPKKYRLKAVDGCLIIDSTQITNSNFLFSTQINCFRGLNDSNKLAYSYIGENEAMCGDHNEMIEESLRRVNPRKRISWQNNCDEQAMEKPTIEPEAPEILKWDVKEEVESDELFFIFIVIFFLLTFIAFVGPFVLSRINAKYKRSTDPYGPYGPLSDDERQVDKPFMGFMNSLDDYGKEVYTASLKGTKEDGDNQQQQE